MELGALQEYRSNKKWLIQERSGKHGTYVCLKLSHLEGWMEGSVRKRGREGGWAGPRRVLKARLNTSGLTKAEGYL